MNAIDVVCPECKAAIGASCMNPKRDGREIALDFHDSRVKYRDSMEAANCTKTHLEIPSSEPYFVLRAQDASACQLVQLWISLNHEAPPEKIASAKATLCAMQDWPRKKRAD